MELDAFGAFLVSLGVCLALQPFVYWGSVRLGLTSLYAPELGPKPRSWILTTLNALVMSVSSLPFLISFFTHPAALDSAPLLQWQMSSAVVCGFFVSYLLADMIIGTLLYPSEMPWLSYFHHSIYTLMVVNIIHEKLHPCFLLMGILEAPYLFLCLAQMHKPLRNDFLFGSTYFLTRIVFHLYFTYHIAFEAFTSTWFFLYPLSVFPLHVYWFRGFVLQQLRLYKERTVQKNQKMNESAELSHEQLVEQKSSYQQKHISESVDLKTDVSSRRESFIDSVSHPSPHPICSASASTSTSTKSSTSSKNTYSLKTRRPFSVSESSSSSSSSTSASATKQKQMLWDRFMMTESGWSVYQNQMHIQHQYQDLRVALGKGLENWMLGRGLRRRRVSPDMVNTTMVAAC